jgi:hypothetical protein
MGLFDIFTGDPYKDAAAKSLASLQGSQNQILSGISQASDKGIGALQSGQTGALGAVGSGFGQGRTDISQATMDALNQIYGGANQGRSDLLSSQIGGLGALQSGVNQATGAYSPVSALSNQYAGFNTNASQAQQDALGLNGPEGIARSRAAFQTTPGYDFAKNQAVEGATRGFNAAGGALGGNTLSALSDLVGNQIAPAQWNQYMSGLTDVQNRYAPLALSGAGTAAGGVANAALTGGTGGANIITGTGQRLSDLASTTGARAAQTTSGGGQSLANLASQGGLAEGNIFTGTGSNIANLLSTLSGQQTSGLGALAGPMANTYNTAAAGSMLGSQNLWNLGLSAAKGFAGTPLGSSALSSVGLA